MSRYFFHVRNGNVIYIDRQGAEFVDLKAAWQHALLDACIIFRARETTERWIEIEDSLGVTVTTPPREVTFH